MADYRASVRYRAPVAAVYDAAARPGGTNGWWSTSGATAVREGDVMRLNWADGDFVDFRLERLDRPRAMRWTCVDQRDRNLPEPDEWVGTTLSFEFAPDDGGTRLDFVHEGLVPELDCYDVCEGGWDFFLRRSLRALVEVGEGMPYEAAGRRRRVSARSA